MTPKIVGEHVTKVFGRGEAEVVALDDASISVEAGELVALMGRAVRARPRCCEPCR
jgi:ABC-type multidrug transport system ATPase subunit